MEIDLTEQEKQLISFIRSIEGHIVYSFFEGEHGNSERVEITSISPKIIELTSTWLKSEGHKETFIALAKEI